MLGSGVTVLADDSVCKPSAGEVWLDPRRAENEPCRLLLDDLWLGVRAGGRVGMETDPERSDVGVELLSITAVVLAED